jgi:hypothetical protein
VEPLRHEGSRARREIVHPLGGEQLTSAVAEEAEAAARRGLSSWRWQHGEEMVGCRRGVATFPLARDTFDALFNGRSGYRAQYYLSCEDGIQFNSEIIRALTKPLALTYQKVPAEEFAVLERSFVGPYSKIWVLGDRAPFLAAQEKEYLCPGVGSRTIRSHWGCARRYPIHQ